MLEDLPSPHQPVRQGRSSDFRILLRLRLPIPLNHLKSFGLETFQKNGFK
jgi:hypothetical protein